MPAPARSCHDGHVADPTRSCRRCNRPGPPLDSPRSLEWEPIVKDKRIVGMICPRCMTYDDMRRRKDELDKLSWRLKRLERGLPLKPR
jgi:hypothetical protein